MNEVKAVIFISRLTASQNYTRKVNYEEQFQIAVSLRLTVYRGQIQK